MSQASLPMLISGVAILTNTAGNYILIFGKLGLPAMGVRGAAIATVAARILECVLMVGLSLRRGSILRRPFRDYLAFDFAFARNAYVTILPVVMNEGLWGVGAVLYTAAYGRIGVTALAATNIANTVQSFFMVLCFGVSSAALVMTGQQIGAGEKERARLYANRFTILTGLMGLLLGLAIVATAPLVLSFFNISEAGVRAAVNILRIFGVTYAVRQTNLVLLVGIFRGGGDTKVCLAIDLSTMWLIGVPLAFMGAFWWHLTVEQVVALISLEEFVKTGVSFWRLKSGRWIHDVTEAGTV
jgi:putative MATE family efflux protein